MTKQQIFDAALKYAQEQNPGKNKASVGPDRDFIAGAMWAADEIEVEKSRLREALEEIIDRYEVANMLAGDDPVIEKAKNALCKPHST